MLDTLRDYGLRICDQLADSARLRRLHRDHFREMAQQAATTWLTPRELEVMATVQQHLQDLLAALDYCIRQGELATARLILRDIIRSRAPFFWGFLGLISQLLQNVIDASARNAAEAPADTESAADAADIAATTAMASWIAVTVGRREDAERLITHTEDLLETHGVGAIPPILFAAGGYKCLAAGDSEGIGLLTASRALTPGPEFAGDRQMATMVRAMGLSFTGEPQAAVRASTEYLQQAKQTRAPWDISWALWTCALANLRTNDHEQANASIDACLRAQREMDDQWGQTWSIELSAWIIAAQLDHADNPRAQARRSQWLLGAAQARQDRLGVGLSGLAPFAAQRATAENSNSRYLDSIAMAAAFEQGLNRHREALAVALGEPLPRSHRATAHPGGLSDRERQIVEQVAAGLTSADIGESLHLATGTVNTHVKRILSKLALHNRAALATWAAENLDTP